MSFLRIEKKKSGSYIRILESYRNEAGKSTHRILFSLGKIEDYTPEQLQRIGIKLYELGGGEFKLLLKSDLIELGRYNYGYQIVYSRALKHYGIDDVLRRINTFTKIEFNLYNAAMLMLLERLQDPASKRSNYVHQSEYLNLPHVQLHHLYRTLDKLADYNELIQKHIFQKGRDLFNLKLDVVFYDVTTFYFESEVENEDSIRQMGFGKDGKIGHTQILFSLIIDGDKNPIGYRVYKGNTYEGDTFEKALSDLKKRYQIDKVVIVADRGMLSKKNIAIAQSNEYEFILGERLKSLPATVKSKLINLNDYKAQWLFNDNEGKEVNIKYTTLELGDKTIIGTYSEKRAKKDREERLAKIEKAEILLKNKSRLKTKQRRFFIKEIGDQKYELDNDKINESEKYDGFLAISTNTSLPITEVLDNYKQLYKIEHSFRTFKSQLETRPMFHWTNKRIEGHICLCYIAFTVQNYILKKLNNKVSESKLREILNKMQFSLIQKDNEKYYLRSAAADKETTLLNALGIKQMLPLIKYEDMDL